MDSGGHDSTFVIAVYGAVLSSVVFLFELLKYYDDKPKLVVKTSASLFYENGDLTKNKKKISIEMINPGKRHITILYCGFKIKSDSIINMQQVIDPNLPKQLSEGESYISYADFVVEDFTKIVYAWAKDATGKEFKSVKWPLDGFA